MQTRKKRKILTPALEDLFSLEVPAFDAATLVEYYGVVNYATTERVLASVKALALRSLRPTLLVTSAGGPSGTAMSFYDAVRTVLRIDMDAIGAGDVDSSGLLLFLSGTRRFVTEHTTALLHPAGRVFDGGTRLTALELSAMAHEDRIKDAQYADIVARNSRGLLTPEAVLGLMEAHTVLTAEDFVRFGLAERVLA